MQVTFSGENNENVTKWLKDVTNAFKLAGFSDTEKNKSISTFLRDHALTWYTHNMDDMDIWSKFNDNVQKPYSSPLVKEQAASSKPSTRCRRSSYTLLSTSTITSTQIYPQHQQMFPHQYGPSYYLKAQQQYPGVNTNYYRYQQTQQQRLPPLPRCYQCNRTGHFARDCWSKNF
ncbi:unnamed protein product [Didymodactylos carnosus]|uniref:CCHC-type domain-containing protein n=1 Tax=Didymodactylos carnosus TaxID=1234261 RepID=A0A815HUJ5_9BILA|nr:unnamed protein product [Didymodactylos carnosus]CAF4237037.1 unnamed protein product [Didymodactylos carnosus]